MEQNISVTRFRADGSVYGQHEMRGVRNLEVINREPIPGVTDKWTGVRVHYGVDMTWLGTAPAGGRIELEAI